MQVLTVVLAALAGLAVVVTAAVLAGLAGVAAYQWWAWSRLVTCRVMVNLRDGTAVEGVLLHRRGPLMTLAEAQVIEPPASPVPATGHVVIERPAVLFMQVLDPGAGRSAMGGVVARLREVA